MQIRSELRKQSALTLTEVLFVIVGILFLAAVALTLLTKRQATGRATVCQNHLKQIGLTFKVWANDNQDTFPYFTTNCLAYTNATQAWMHFLVMSNELGLAAILACPEDAARNTNWVADFTSGPNGFLSKTNRAVSYFVGLEADETLPNALLTGDRNLLGTPEALNPMVLPLATNLAVRWSSDLHTNSGNVVLADGSVQAMNRSGLHAHLARGTGLPTNRLLLPLVP